MTRTESTNVARILRLPRPFWVLCLRLQFTRVSPCLRFDEARRKPRNHSFWDWVYDPQLWFLFDGRVLRTDTVPRKEAS